MATPNPVGSLLQTFKRVKGTERFVNLITGEEVSRRQRDKVRLAAQGNIKSYEELAKFNRQLNEDEQLARPARGRTSAKNLAAPIKTDVVKARKEVKQQRAATKKEQKAQRLVDRKIEAAKRKKVHVKKFSGRLLKAGRMGARVPFNTYGDYEILYADAKKSKLVFAYGLGLNGVDARTGQPVTPTIFRMRAFDGIIGEEEFYEAMEGFIESRSYFIAVSYYIHFAFAKGYAEDKAKKAGKRK